jgi:hypothetical protein
MHGKFSQNLEEKLTDKENSYRWLKLRNIMEETKYNSDSSRPKN